MVPGFERRSASQPEVLRNLRAQVPARARPREGRPVPSERSTRTPRSEFLLSPFLP